MKKRWLMRSKRKKQLGVDRGTGKKSRALHPR